jgi:hypothetical protein
MALHTQNSNLTVDLLEDDDLDKHERAYWKDTIVRMKQVIYWPNFMMMMMMRSRRRRRRRRRP